MLNHPSFSKLNNFCKILRIFIFVSLFLPSKGDFQETQSASIAEVEFEQVPMLLFKETQLQMDYLNRVVFLYFSRNVFLLPSDCCNCTIAVAAFNATTPPCTCPVTVVIISVCSQFLDRCTEAMSLPFAARRLFTETGKELTSVKGLERDQLVYVSSGDAWINPTLTHAEQQRRSLLANLASDVNRMRNYVTLREQTGMTSCLS